MFCGLLVLASQLALASPAAPAVPSEEANSVEPVEEASSVPELGAQVPIAADDVGEPTVVPAAAENEELPQSDTQPDEATLPSTATIDVVPVGDDPGEDAVDPGVIIGFPVLRGDSDGPGDVARDDSEGPAVVREVLGYLPTPPKPSFWGAVTFFLLALGAKALSAFSAALRGRLAATGLLPLFTRFLDVGGRIASLGFAVWAGLHLVPPALAPLVSFVLLGVAFAVGWSARGYVADALYGIGLLLGRGVRRDEQLGLADMNGRVLRVGLFSTAIWSSDGRIIRIPNRELSKGAVSSGEETKPRTELTVRLPVSSEPQKQHALLRDCVLLSPYLDDGGEPEIWQDAEHSEVWHIRVVLGSETWAQAFREACRRTVRTERFDL